MREESWQIMKIKEKYKDPKKKLLLLRKKETQKGH